MNRISFQVLMYILPFIFILQRRHNLAVVEQSEEKKYIKKNEREKKWKKIIRSTVTIHIT